MNWAANRATKGLGASFKGVSAYLLSPKEEGQTLEERVAFTACHNLATDDPTRAWRLMAETAIRRDELKLLAGGSLAGRKPAEGAFKPVFHYSLAWHPDQNPNPAEMERAALATLKALKLDHHEALLVAHADESHAHLHVVVNRVDPENGKLHPLSNAFRKLDRWAAEYERETGQIVSRNREEKHQAIDEGRPRPERQRWLPHEEYTQARQVTREAAHQARRDADVVQPPSRWQSERDSLWESQQAANTTMLEAAKLRARNLSQELRDRQRPGWQALGRGQAHCRQELAQALRGNHSDVAAFINRHNELLQKAWLDPEKRKTEWSTLLTRGGLEQAVTRAQAFQTAEFKRDVTHDRHAMQRAFWADYRQAVDQLRDGQKAERVKLRDQQRERSAGRMTATGIEGGVPSGSLPAERKPDMAKPTTKPVSNSLRVDRPSKSEVFPLGRAKAAVPQSRRDAPETSNDTIGHRTGGGGGGGSGDSRQSDLERLAARRAERMAAQARVRADRRSRRMEFDHPFDPANRDQ